MAETQTRNFEDLLQLMKRGRGFDFTGYKRSTLERRVRKRMAAVGLDDFAAYADYLEVHAEEFRELFNTILINVTGFFRDPQAWNALSEQVISPLTQDPDRTVRVWSAGCASGEETYTLVMLLAQAVGVQRFKSNIKIYATDADDEALTQARNAQYSTKSLEAVPEPLRLKYFEPNGEAWTFRHDLRRCVIFGKHDLVQDAPISRLDLLVCRNTLIYFNSETQARILGRFHFALTKDAYLFLGRSEMLLSHSRLFAPLDARARIFVKLPNFDLRERLLVLAQTGTPDEAEEEAAQHTQLREASFNAAPIAQFILDRAGTVLMANDAARKLFRIDSKDLGRPIQDLEISYRPIDLRSGIDQAYATQATVSLPDVKYNGGQGEARHFDVQITPLREQNRDAGISITFADVTTHFKLRQELERATNELETAYEELQATNEELETTNEELQSTIEELETTNEELQSTNEELETMNEELQSTNEELETINEELRRRTLELNSVNDFLETIMTSVEAGVAVTDNDMHVLLWNSKAEEMWGLRREEVESKVFTNLHFGLPVDELVRPLRRCLEGKSEFEEAYLQAVNRRGQPIGCRVTCTRLVTPQQEPRGVIVQMEEWNEGAP